MPSTLSKEQKKKNNEEVSSRGKSVLGSYTQEDLNFDNSRGSGFFSLTCGKASDNLDYNFGEEFYLEVYLDDETFRDILGKIYHAEFEAIIVRCNLGNLKGIYAEKPTGVYTENGFITDGQAYKLLYEKADVSNYSDMPDHFGSVGSISKGNPFIVDVYYASKDYKKTKPNKAKQAFREQKQVLDSQAQLEKDLEMYKYVWSRFFEGDTAIVSDNTNGVFNLLKWDRREAKYYPIAFDLNQKG